MYAYDLPSYDQLVGLPQGLGTYDVDAKTPAPSTISQERTMLRAVLAESFHLVCHWEKRLGRAYVLNTAGKLRLRADSEEGESENRLTVEKDGSTGWLFKRMPMTAFSRWLAERLGGPVQDATKLAGRYDFEIAMSRLDSSPERGAPILTAGSGFGGLNDYNGALMQLGLRLAQSRATIDTLVVDHIEKLAEQ